MARNRGKRPGAASGSSSPSQSQARDTQARDTQARDTEVKTGDTPAGGSSSAGGPAAAKTPAAASPGIAAKIEGSASKAEAPKAPAATSTSQASTSQVSRAQTRDSVTKSPSATSGSATAAGGTSASGGSGGFWPGLIGGVIGGAATALAASLFWMDGDGSATTALESRLAAAEQQVGEIGALNDRVAAVEAAPADGGDLAKRLDDLETSLAALGGAPSGGEPTDGAGDALGERVTSLEQQLETFSGMEQKIEALAGEVQIAGETQAANVQALTSLETTLPTLEETLAATGLSVGQASEQTAVLNQSVETLNGSVEVLATRVGDAESRLDHLGGEYQRGAAMIVAIGDINRAVTRAEPFDGPLQTLKSLVRDEKVLGNTLSTLEPMAMDGVPTLKALKSEYGQMASRVLLAEEGDPSLTDQVSNNVFGIFNIRPSGGDTEGSGSRAILARTQAKLSADDLEGAILELAGLEGSGADKAVPWIERAGARLAAEAALVDLRSHAQGLVAQGS